MFLFILLPLSAQAADSVDYGNCIPKQGPDFDPNEYTLSPTGHLAVRERDRFYSVDEEKETNRRKVAGQSGYQKAVLRKKDGRPASLLDTYPAYDSKADSYAMETFFGYSEDRCLVTEVAKQYFDGEYKNQAFVFYHRGLCEEIDGLFQGYRLRADRELQQALQIAQRSIGKHLMKGKQLHALRHLKPGEKIDEEGLFELQSNCVFVGKRYPQGERKLQRFLRNLLQGGEGAQGNDGVVQDGR